MDRRPPRFACDAMLGALARWLRLAGYDASSHPGIPDPELVALAEREDRVLLSCDAGIFERRAVREDIAALQLPQEAETVEQLALVLARYDLPLRFPRCTSCGGSLREASATEIEAAPAESRRAVVDFWTCRRCGRLLWRGAHWRRIDRQLRQAEERAAALRDGPTA